MSPRSLSLGLLAATALVALLAPAFAADLDDNYGYAEAPQEVPVAETKVEFGTGWYVRGDIGVTTLPSLHLNPSSYVPTDTSFIPPPAPTLLIGSGSNAGYVASLGAGYEFNRWFRSDVMVDFHEPITSTGSSGNGNIFCPTGISYPNKTTDATTGAIDWGSPSYATGGCTGNYRGHLQSFDALVNGYFDIGHWYNMTPYVGAGVGLSFGHYQTSATYVQSNGVAYQVSVVDPQYGTSYYNYDRSASGTYYNFAYALMAGVAFDILPHTKLDIGYRYLNLGTVPHGGGTLYEHEARAGLRYMIDN